MTHDKKPIRIAVAAGDQRQALEAIAERGANQLANDEQPPHVVAPIARQLTLVLAEIGVVMVFERLASAACVRRPVKLHATGGRPDASERAAKRCYQDSAAD